MVGFSQGWGLAEQVLQKVMGRVSPGFNTSMAKTADHGASLEGGKEAGRLLMTSRQGKGRKNRPVVVWPEW